MFIDDLGQTKQHQHNPTFYRLHLCLLPIQHQYEDIAKKKKKSNNGCTYLTMDQLLDTSLQQK